MFLSHDSTKTNYDLREILWTMVSRREYKLQYNIKRKKIYILLYGFHFSRVNLSNAPFAHFLYTLHTYRIIVYKYTHCMIISVVCSGRV